MWETIPAKSLAGVHTGIELLQAICDDGPNPDQWRQLWRGSGSCYSPEEDRNCNNKYQTMYY